MCDTDVLQIVIQMCDVCVCVCVCRILEQLVLYLRALQMMAQSITLAQREMKKDRLQYVNSLKKGQ